MRKIAAQAYRASEIFRLGMRVLNNAVLGTPCSRALISVASITIQHPIYATTLYPEGVALYLIGIAAVVAVPIASIGISTWLPSFAYHILSQVYIG